MGMPVTIICDAIIGVCSNKDVCAPRILRLYENIFMHGLWDRWSNDSGEAAYKPDII